VYAARAGPVIEVEVGPEVEPFKYIKKVGSPPPLKGSTTIENHKSPVFTLNQAVGVVTLLYVGATKRGQLLDSVVTSNTVKESGGLGKPMAVPHSSPPGILASAQSIVTSAVEVHAPLLTSYS